MIKMENLALFIGLASECGADMCYMHLVSKVHALIMFVVTKVCVSSLGSACVTS